MCALSRKDMYPLKSTDAGFLSGEYQLTYKYIALKRRLKPAAFKTISNSSIGDEHKAMILNLDLDDITLDMAYEKIDASLFFPSKYGGSVCLVSELFPRVTKTWEGKDNRKCHPRAAAQRRIMATQSERVFGRTGLQMSKECSLSRATAFACSAAGRMRICCSPVRLAAVFTCSSLSGLEGPQWRLQQSVRYRPSWCFGARFRQSNWTKL